MCPYPGTATLAVAKQEVSFTVQGSRDEPLQGRLCTTGFAMARSCTTTKTGHSKNHSRKSLHFLGIGVPSSRTNGSGYFINAAWSPTGLRSYMYQPVVLLPPIREEISVDAY
ncbi:hypothetical protein LCGC14_0810360 [marine sediment metagenome]|uniref:Uncharacterized protein n=1 Tax=marine sediment metagenome TaxID=412755 RepID=A0A0F9Q717_9ZZZZ